MTIIDDISYSPPVTSDIPKKIILQFPSYKRNLEYQRSIRGKVKNMFHTENSITRARKLQSNWNTRSHVKVNNVNQLFRIGELYHDHHTDNEFALPMPTVIDSKYSKKTSHQVKKQGLFGRVFGHFETYCDNSTLHGLRYVGDTSISLAERLFWLIAFGSAIGFAAYYISNIFEKWNMNPVIVSFSPFDADFNEIPFPSVTICNMNQAKKTEAERILREGSASEKKLLYDYCNSNNSFNDSSKDAPSWAQVQNFLVRVGQSCSDTLKACYWKSDPVLCDDYFNNDLTDEGLCCSFNRLPATKVFRYPNDLGVLNQTFRGRVYDWSPEQGFPDKNTGDEFSIPRRPPGAGTHLGLTIIADTRLEDYFCSSTDSTGFKVLISSPIETPKMADFGFLISPGTEARYVIKPEIRYASNALRGVPLLKRQCYFSNERPLFYYRTYTLRNCRLECQSNYTLKSCGCIPYFLPKNKTIKVCGKKDEICSEQAKEDMELIYGNGSSCACLPGCFEISFGKSGSYSHLSKILNYKYDFDDVTQDYFVKNMAVMHFFFQEARFQKTVKSEIYGSTEVLSNVGGLLGLCLGFSFLSLIELIYFFSLRVCCRFFSKYRGRRDKKKHESSVLPFAQ